MDHLCFLCRVFPMLLRLFIAALWSPAGKGLTSWLLSVMFIVLSLLSHVLIGQVWYLIVSLPDLCLLSYFKYITSPLTVTLLNWMLFNCLLHFCHYFNVRLGK